MNASGELGRAAMASVACDVCRSTRRNGGPARPARMFTRDDAEKSQVAMAAEQMAGPRFSDGKSHTVTSGAGLFGSGSTRTARSTETKRTTLYCNSKAVFIFARSGGFALHVGPRVCRTVPFSSRSSARATAETSRWAEACNVDPVNPLAISCDSIANPGLGTRVSCGTGGASCIVFADSCASDQLAAYCNDTSGKCDAIGLP